VTVYTLTDRELLTLFVAIVAIGLIMYGLGALTAASYLRAKNRPRPLRILDMPNHPDVGVGMTEDEAAAWRDLTDQWGRS